MGLIVTGSIGIDSIETPWGRAENVLGGSCTYFAAAASFFCPVRVVAAVGEDFPDDYLKVMEGFDVDLEGLEKRKGSKTFRWSGKYHENMNDRDTTAVEINVLGEDLPNVPDRFRDSKFVFLANTHPAGQAALLDSFAGAELVVADTMDLWIDTALDELKALMKRLDGLVLNDMEAIKLTGERNLVKASQMIVEMGPKFVVIKKGEHGAMLITNEVVYALPIFPTDKVKDPTGAGDSFAAGMMAHIAEVDKVDPATLKRAMAYGACVASVTIEDFSLAALRAADRDTVQKRFEEYRKMLSFD